MSQRNRCLRVNIEGVSDPYKGYTPPVRKAKITRLILMPICCRCTIIPSYVTWTRAAGAAAVAIHNVLGWSRPSAFDKKILLHRQFPDLRVKSLYLTLVLVRSAAAISGESLLDGFHKPLLPQLYLVRMHLEALGEFGQRAVAANGGEGYSAFDKTTTDDLTKRL